LYNGALAILGERKLASLSENREPRHQLDEIYSRDFVERCLRAGQWNFAIRSIKPESSTTITPPFGHEFAFEKPSDLVRLAGFCSDEFFTNPITDYVTESDYWFAHQEDVYIRYVSNDSEYGFDFGKWPVDFTNWVEHELAERVAPRLTGLEYDSDKLANKVKKAKRDASATDAQEQGAKFPPPSSWQLARTGRSRSDRGRRGSLIG
jgi:uncharacterized protein YneR